MNRKKRNAIVALLLVVSMALPMFPTSGVQAADTSNTRQGWYNTEENTGNMNRVPYNNPSLIADLNMGMCAYPVVLDMNEDGIMDLLVYGGAAAEEQVKIFYGTEAGGLVMEKGRKLNPEGYKTLPFTATYFYDEMGNYEKTGLHIAGLQYSDGNPNRNVYDAADYPITDDTIPVVTRTNGTNIFLYSPIDGNKNLSTSAGASLTTMVDYDGNGTLDCINCWDTWYEQGWRFGAEQRYDSEGYWGGKAGSTKASGKELVGEVDGTNDEDGVPDGDPIHGWMSWSQNIASDATTNTSDTPQLIMVQEEDGTEKALDIFGASTPLFFDWDDDGDLDIIAGCWLNDLTYFENIGNRTEPVYRTGRPVELPNGEATQTDMCQVITTGFDWDGDGDMDIIIGEEDGRVSFLECLGVTTDGRKTPIMAAPVRFQAYSDSIDFGTLISIDSVDWDEDGDEDIVAGEDSGRISLLKNITIEEGLKKGLSKTEIDLSNPIWGNTYYLQNEKGEEYRITAGYNGSLQGPSEELFGYSKIDTGDWNGDGILDIISNNIWGIILFHEGIKTTDGTFRAKNPVPIEVDWTNGVLYPSCNWWKPGEETLGVDITDKGGREYKAQWPWWEEVKSENELVVEWRTGVGIVNLPIKNEETGTVDVKKGLVLIDHEGYLSFYEQYEDNGVYKVKEGQRIFTDANGDAIRLSQIDTNTDVDGERGRSQFVLADYDGDNDLDLIVNDWPNMAYRQNTSTESGVYQFATGKDMHTRVISQHVPSPTVCDWDQDGHLDVLMGDEGGNVYYLKNTIAHPTQGESSAVTGETLPTDFTRITPADFGISDGTYANQEVNQKDTPSLTLNKLLFEAKMKHTAGNHFYYMKGINFHTNAGGTYAGLIRLWNYETDTGFYVDDVQKASGSVFFYPNIALGSEYSTFVGVEYRFAVTTEYVDYDKNGQENDLKIGVWFNDKLYEEKYIYIKDYVTDSSNTKAYMYMNITSSLQLSSPDRFKDFTVVTPEDFGIDGHYTAAANNTKSPLSSFNKMLFVSKLQYHTNGGFLCFGDMKMQLRSNGTTLYFWEYYTGTIYVNGTDTGSHFDMSPGTAFGDTSTDFLNKDIHYAVTMEYVNYDNIDNDENGEIKDDLKCGVWFNGKLYNNCYFYAVGITQKITKPVFYLESACDLTIKSPSPYEMTVQPEITDSIAMNCKITVDPMIMQTGDVSMAFDMNGRDTIKMTGTPTTEGGNVFTYKYADIMGQDMAEDLVVSLQVGSASKTYEYSVLDYCVDILSDKGATYSAEIKNLIVDLVQYGAALQKYRGVAESKLLTTKLAAQVQDYADFDTEDESAEALASLQSVPSKLTQDSGITTSDAYKWKSVGLVIGNKVEIRAKFTASDTSNLAIKANIGTEEVEVPYQKTATAGVYSFDFADIYAYEYAEPIAFKFYVNGTQVGTTLHYSVNTYLYAMRDYMGTNAENLKTLLLAIHNYGQSAIAYKDTLADVNE